MPENHTVEFAQCSFNILSDGGRRTLTIQFDLWSGSRQAVVKLLEALQRRFGEGVMSRLRRWRTDEYNPLVLPSGTEPYLADQDVLRYEIGVRQGETTDAA